MTFHRVDGDVVRVGPVPSVPRASAITSRRTPTHVEVLAECEPGEEWTHAGANTIDTTTYKFGTGSLKLVESGAAPWSTIPVDIQQWGRMVQLWVYRDPADVEADYNFVEVEFRVDASNKFEKVIAAATSQQVVGAWQVHTFDKGTCGVTGSPTWGAVTDMRLRARRNSGTAIAYVDSIRTFDTAPGVAIQFDDAYESVYELAFPVMRRYGIPGTVWVITGRVGTADYMSWDQLRDLSQNGWTIGNHTQTGAVLTELTEADLRTELSSAQGDLIDQGFLHGSNLIAATGGNSDATVRQVASEGHVMLREGTGTQPYWHPYRLADAEFSTGRYQSIDVADWTTVSGYLDDALTFPAVASLVAHKIEDTDTPSGSTTSLSVFRQLCERIASEGIMTMTVLDMYEPVG